MLNITSICFEQVLLKFLQRTMWRIDERKDERVTILSVESSCCRCCGRVGGHNSPSKKWQKIYSFHYKMGNPWPLFYFCLFKQSLQFLQQINLKKCPSGIRCWDLNTWPSVHEPPPITTRPDFLPWKYALHSVAF